jgi:pimeloyl-ACP methyl ester carboxylesterase
MDGRSLPARRAGRGTRKAAVVAAGLAATAAFFYARARQAERRHPPLGRLFRIDGVQVHVHIAGEGPPLVLLNGNGSMVHDWLVSGLFDRLRRSYRVIAIDRPGYGYSERPRDRIWTPRIQAGLVRRTLAHLGVERPIVLGHSWGTLVALALEHPKEVRGLVLLSGYYFPTARLDVWALSPPAIPLIGDAMRYTVWAASARLIAPIIVRRSFAPLPVPPRFAMRFPLKLALRPWQLKASAEDSAFMVPAAAALRKRYRALGIPVAILSGTEDRIIAPNRQSIRLHETIPQSELTLLPGLGHMIHYFAQDEIAAAVDGVLRRSEERREAGATPALRREVGKRRLAAVS